MFDILVIGSINADLVFTSSKRPNPGETIMGEDFKIIPGGKGANQAVAAARLGSKVGFIGCIGNDENGKMLIENFKRNNVETKYINVVEDNPSGVANIIIAEGDNSIIVVPGANYSITKDIIDKNTDIIKSSKVILLQQEIPIDVVEHIVDICHQNKVKTILNPAPASKIKSSIVEKVNYLTPNEHEAKLIFEDLDIDEMLKSYPEKLIITEGSKGVRYSNGNEIIGVPTLKVKALDTTGAGDTFNGAFATGIARGQDLQEIIKFANKAAAISVTKFGAQSGMPYLKEIED